MKNKKPKVSLINSTPDAIATMCWVRRVMHSSVPDSLQELKDDPEKWLGMNMDEYVREVLLKDGMPTFLEYVSVTFKLENVSRALQQQLTRHRIGFSYSIQSLRCVDLPNFAEQKEYYNPYQDDTLENKEYHQRMLNIQRDYRELLDKGVNVQDARGILPMNVFSTITFNCSIRALIGMVNKRLCLKTQEEFREVADQIVEKILALDPRFSKWFGKPCDFGRCMMDGENYAQYKEGKLTGKQNTDHVCPIYLNKFVDSKKDNFTRGEDR